MITRRIEQRDFAKGRELYEKYYKDEFFLPDADECIICDVIEENGEIIGFNIVRPTFESIMLFDKSKSKRTIIRALREAFISGLAKLSSLGLDTDQVHAFIQDDDFARVLKRKFNFVKTKGECVVLRMD